MHLSHHLTRNGSLSDSSPVCSFCGLSPPATHWHASRRIWVCTHCAVRVLPGLIVGAQPGINPAEVKLLIGQVTDAIHRAALRRISQEQKQEDPSRG